MPELGNLITIIALAFAIVILLRDSITNKLSSVIVVALVWRDEKGIDWIETHGTGFVINSHGFIATAKHVIKDKPNKTCSIEILVANKWHKASCVWKHNTMDIAVLQINEPVEKKLKPIKLSEKISTNDRAVVWGYPGIEEEKSCFYLQEIPIEIISAHLSWISGKVYKNHQQQYKGLSGGPLLNKQGQAVALAISVPEKDVIIFTPLKNFIPQEYLSP